MRTKKVKPPPKAHEYALNISKVYDEIHKRSYISFKFRTTKEFLTFQYILKIQATVEDKKLSFAILGFSAPTSELSVSGHAGFEFRFYEFKYEEYTIFVERKDSAKMRFKLLVQKSKSEPLKVSHVPKDSFIEITYQ